MQVYKKNITKLSFAVILAALLVTISFAADHPPDRQVSRQYLKAEINEIVKKYGQAAVPYLDQYFADPCDRVRKHAASALYNIGTASTDQQIRRSIVYKLLTVSVGENFKRAFQVERLLGHPAADFSEQSMQFIREHLDDALNNPRNSQRRQIILLAGAADLKSELPKLKAFIEKQEPALKARHKAYIERQQKIVDKVKKRYRNPPAYITDTVLKQYWQDTLMWAALRARARLGVKEDIRRCIDLVESHPSEDDYRVGRLLLQLSYVRQPEVVEYLHGYLLNDKLERYKGNDVIRLSYAQRAAVALAQMLRGFPGRKDIGGGPELIAERRKWMAEQKSWDIIR